ncbi:MAG: ZPR1 zinc finger domain-containing protein [Candidatus Methanosuratus sp.]|nr:ZPR1 zinc finger domain-containing protein [Candidatus Methanosuratincola sp.]
MDGKEHFSYKAICPGCGEAALSVEELYDEIPGLGRAVLVSMRCAKCGMAAYHEIPLENRGIRKVEFRVSEEKHLTARVIRSPTGMIRIPELGLELSPGSRPVGFVTNVEGVLQRFLDVAEQLAGTAEGPEKEGAEMAIRRIRSAISGALPFTIIIEDDLGNSAIIPPD